MITEVYYLWWWCFDLDRWVVLRHSADRREVEAVATERRLKVWYVERAWTEVTDSHLVGSSA